jgi:plasmid stabilization system protein ParE
VKVNITSPARRQAERLDRWWRENRPAVPQLFAQELSAALKLIESLPEAGTPYVERRGVIVRRVLLSKTTNHVYYEIDRSLGVVMILAVWGAPRAKGPKL